MPTAGGFRDVRPDRVRRANELDSDRPPLKRRPVRARSTNFARQGSGQLIGPHIRVVSTAHDRRSPEPTNLRPLWPMADGLWPLASGLWPERPTTPQAPHPTLAA